MGRGGNGSCGRSQDTMRTTRNQTRITPRLVGVLVVASCLIFGVIQVLPLLDEGGPRRDVMPMVEVERSQPRSG